MKLFDPIYGEMQIEPSLVPIVNSGWFRRLQQLRQLGLCYLSFPGGNHSRFEHSLGASHLAKRACQNFEFGTTIKSIQDRARLGLILQASLLCHDIGHGPFSHMTENVLHGLGVDVSHEEIGAAIVSHKLDSEFSRLKSEWDISPEIVANVITKSPIADPLARAAVSLTSGDLDLDRIDYLYRDTRYAGAPQDVGAAPTLEDVWRVNRIGEDLHLELTENGLSFAESILLKRRNNYGRIVYESRHMAATAMFEKAIGVGIRDGRLKDLFEGASKTNLDWTDAQSVERNFDALWAIYGLVDYSLLALLREASEDCSYLIRRVQQGAMHESVLRCSWRELHYLTKHVLLGLKKETAAFALRRRFEDLLAEKAAISAVHVAVHLPKVPGAVQISAAVSDGTTFGERSPLGHFLQEDAIRQYAIELFVDQSVDSGSRDIVRKTFIEMVVEGRVGELRDHAG